MKMIQNIWQPVSYALCVGLLPHAPHWEGKLDMLIQAAKIENYQSPLKFQLSS
jgi:hypothetical protein